MEFSPSRREEGQENQEAENQVAETLWPGASSGSDFPTTDEADQQRITELNEDQTECKECGGLGQVSNPVEAGTLVCPVCGGTGKEE